MKYAFDELIGQWVVLASGDVVVHTCESEQEVIEYIEAVEKMNLNRAND